MTVTPRQNADCATSRPTARFARIEGTLAPERLGVPSGDGKLILSQIRKGVVASPPRRSIGLKYVASGTEYYCLDNRSYVVEGGNFLFVPEGFHGEAGRATVGETAFGLCVHLRDRDAVSLAAERLEEPIIFPVLCSPLGRMLERTHRSLHARPERGAALAGPMLDRIDAGIETFLGDALRGIDSMTAVKRATRYENFRRLNAAQAYLHDINDRPVELAELARVARMSRFQLARLFADRFGLPPSAYHRRLRLVRAQAMIAAGKINCTEAAFRYGFGGSAQFSRAYSRTFGIPPSRSKTQLINEI
ncbi:AraC family transcriptional regulator [Sphingomicrobium sp. XHP0239]|uniref:AraC family transcriptional regulator n=1 Tax=Sphingomicrobium maritimum TaxID=3133972 RepID=UPI0031CC5A8C